MILYKLTDANDTTYNNTIWAEGIVYETDGTGEMCGPGWLHAYRGPLTASFCNPIHANFKNPKLWLVEGEVEKDDGLKVGCRKLTALRREEAGVPELSVEVRIRVAIRCAMSVYKDPAWTAWAEKWLSEEDRSEAAAQASWAAARASRAAEAAEEAAEAAQASWAAARAARAAEAAQASWAAARASRAAAAAAEAAEAAA